MIAFRATAEPMLMSEIATPEPNETQTAFKGIFQPGLTYSMSIVGHYFWNNGADPSQERGERQSVVSGKCPDLPGSGSNLTDDGRDKCDNNDSCQCIGTGIASGNIVEVLDERISCTATEDSLGISDCEAQRENGNEA